MKVTITTERLPNKYPKGAVYEVGELTGALSALVAQGEAFIGEEVKEEDVELTRDEIKEELAKREIEFKGNAKTEDLKELLK